MNLKSLFTLERKATENRAVNYAERVKRKYGGIKFRVLTDEDPFMLAFSGQGDTDDMVLLLETFRFFAERTAELLNETECFHKPATYEMLVKYFIASRKLTSHKFVAVPVGENTVLVLTGINKPGVPEKFYSFYVKPHKLLSDETQSKVTSDEARDWYIYAVTCLTFTNMATTTFVNIDDDQKLEDARKRVKSGNFELPLKELAFLNYSEYPWEEVHYHFPIFDKVTTGPNGYSRNLPCSCKVMPKVELPEINLEDMEDKLYNLFAWQMQTQDLVGADTETTGLNVFFSKIVSLGLTFNLKVGFYLSFRHTTPKSKALDIQSLSFIRFLAKQGLDGKAIVADPIKYYRYMDRENKYNLSEETAKDICRRMRYMKSIWHNAKFDYSMILNDFKVDLPIYMDTMLAHYISRPGYGGDREKRGLKVIAPEELGIESWKIDVTKVQDDYKDIEAAYNARDCCYMFGIAMSLGLEVLKPSTYALLQIEMGYLPVLVGAELAGVRLDVKKLKQIEYDLTMKRDNIIGRLTGLFNKALIEKFDLFVANSSVFGKPFAKNAEWQAYLEDPTEENKIKLIKAMTAKFNLNSGPLMKFLFFNVLGVIPPRKCKQCGTRNFDGSDACSNRSCANYGVAGTAPYEFVSKTTGEPSFDKHVKNILAEKGDELMKDLNEYSAAVKLLSAYCTLDQKVNPLTGNIHPSYNQAKTATGRLSSSRPNFLRKLYTYCWKL